MKTFKVTQLTRALITLCICITIFGCNKNNKKIPTSVPDPTPVPAPNSTLSTVLPLHTEVFGITIRGTKSTSKAAMTHAANVMAQYLDNNEDGAADNQAVVDHMVSQKATLLMTETETAIEAVFNQIPPTRAMQDLYASEVHPNGASIGEFDGALEEILHLITHVGYAGVYPEIFGEVIDSTVADAMDIARGDRFTTIPASYPADAWYTYTDETCEYNCMVTEYIYWALTSILGAQSYEGRLENIQHEWKLNTKEKVQMQDPAIYNILTNGLYSLPTVLPNGSYQYQQFTITDDSAN